MREAEHGGGELKFPLPKWWQTVEQDPKLRRLVAAYTVTVPDRRQVLTGKNVTDTQTANSRFGKALGPTARQWLSVLMASPEVLRRTGSTAISEEQFAADFTGPLSPEAGARSAATLLDAIVGPLFITLYDQIWLLSRRRRTDPKGLTLADEDYSGTVFLRDLVTAVGLGGAETLLAFALDETGDQFRSLLESLGPQTRLAMITLRRQSDQMKATEKRVVAQAQEEGWAPSEGDLAIARARTAEVLRADLGADLAMAQADGQALSDADQLLYVTVNQRITQLEGPRLHPDWVDTSISSTNSAVTTTEEALEIIRRSVATVFHNGQEADREDLTNKVYLRLLPICHGFVGRISRGHLRWEAGRAALRLLVPSWPIIQPVPDAALIIWANRSPVDPMAKKDDEFVADGLIVAMHALLQHEHPLIAGWDERPRQVLLDVFRSVLIEPQKIETITELARLIDERNIDLVAETSLGSSASPIQAMRDVLHALTVDVLRAQSDDFNDDQSPNHDSLEGDFR